MKKIILFFILCVLIINVVSSARFDSEWWEDKFESNPDKTWERFEKDPGLWKDEVAREAAFKKDRSRAISIINEQIAEKYGSLQSVGLDQNDFFMEGNLTNLIDKAIKENASILNENIFLKREWFAQKGIIDQGGEIEFFDGEIIKTKGIDSTTFNITDEIFSGAKILSSGKLILKDGTEISSSVVSKDSEGGLIFQGGQIDLSPLSEMEFNMKEGEIKVGDKIYSNDLNKVFYVSSKDGFVTLKGENVIERDDSGLILSKFTGTLKTNDHKVLGESTTYTLFSNGKESRIYNVNKATDFYSKEGGCEESPISCIEETRFFKTKSYRLLTNLQERSGSEIFDLNEFLEKEKNSLEFQQVASSDPAFRLVEGLIDSSKSENFDLGNYLNLKLKNLGREVEIIPRNDNLISFESFDDSIGELSVGQIKDESSFIFNDQEKVRLTFSKEPVEVQGNFAKLSSNVRSLFVDDQGEIHNLYFEDGAVTQCSFPCLDFTLTSIIGPRLKELRGKDSVEGQKYFEQIRKKYGNQAQIWYLDYLVVNKNPRVYKAVIATSQQLYERTGQKISPEFLYTVAVAEGLDGLITFDGVNTDEISGFTSFGLDNFGDNVQFMKKYLPEDFIEGERYTLLSEEDRSYFENERGETVDPGMFTNIEDAFIAQMAELGWRQEIFFNDLKELGIDKNELSKDALNFWTNVYYNSGQGTGKKMIKSYKDRGYLENDDYIWKRPNEFWKTSYFPANRRMANLKLVENSGLMFPKIRD